MPTVNLELSQTSVYMDNSYNISTIPFTATLPILLKGATFNAVNITYTKYAQGVSCDLCWDGGSLYDRLTNESMLSKLQNGELEDTFTLRMVKYAKGIARISDIVIEIDYNPASDISGTITYSDESTVFFSSPKNSVCGNEQLDLLMSIHPTTEVSKVKLEVADSARTGIAVFEMTATCPANKSTTIYMPVVLGSTALASRVNNAYIKVSLTTASGVIASSWVLCGSVKTLHLVSSRVAPTMTATVTDTSTVMSYFGKMVKGKSLPRITITPTLDTTADDDITLSSRTVQLTNGTDTQQVTSGNNVFDVSELQVSGTVTYTVYVTDSYGVSGTYSGTIDVLDYFAPVISSLSFQRYSEKVSPQGIVYYELDDTSEDIWVNLVANIASLNGKNGYTITAQYSDEPPTDLPSNSMSGTVVMATGADGTALSWEQDREKFTTPLSENSEWYMTVTISDYYSTVTAVVTIGKSGAILDVEPTGVSVGKRSEGTRATPLFECQYDAIFYGNVTMHGQGGDVPWTALGTSLTAATSSTEHPFMACKKNGVVYLRGAFKVDEYLGSGAGDTGRRVIGYLPSDFRPSYRYDMLLNYDRGTAGAVGIRMWIEATTGKLTVENRSGSSLGALSTDLFANTSYVP